MSTVLYQNSDFNHSPMAHPSGIHPGVATATFISDTFNNNIHTICNQYTMGNASSFILLQWKITQISVQCFGTMQDI